MGGAVLSPRQARRIAVRAQLLDASRPTDAGDVIRRLSLVQADLTDAVAPSADLVLASRLGASYRPDHLDELLRSGEVYEVRGMLRPVQDLPLLRAEMAVWPGDGSGSPLKEWQMGLAEWVEANDHARREVLAALRTEGPLPTCDLPDEIAVPWRSSGWNNNLSLGRLVDQMVQRGEVALAGREGRIPVWDLAERVYPDDPVPPAAEALAARRQARLRSLGIARPGGGDRPGDPDEIGSDGIQVRIEGTPGRWLIDPQQWEQRDTEFAGRTAVLSPLDRLIFDRTRMERLFGFDYQLEMYKPAAKRKWGFFALPVLQGDQLIGKVDASSDHALGVLRVDALHQDRPWSATTAGQVEAELRQLAQSLGLRLQTPVSSRS
ncbi:DNA glycosylase AlkZ-like family protein [Dermacoccaceae bacterium W4C1]